MRPKNPKNPIRRLTARRFRGGPLRRALTGLALVGAASLGIAACGGSSSGGSHHHTKSTTTQSNVTARAARDGTVLTGTLPAVGKAAKGGTLTMAQITGQTPTYLFPIIPGANSSTASFALVSQLWLPLYYGPDGARPQINYALSAAAGPPKPSNGDKTYTIKLKSGLKWSDGQPITSQDVVFYIDLLKAALKENIANWGQYVPGEFPLDVTSVSAPDATTVVINLDKAYNPGFFLNNQLQDTNGGVYPLPSSAWNISSAGGTHITDWATNPADATAIYNYLNKQGQSLSTFASNPLWQVVDGPFKLQSFSTTNGSYTLVANPSYGLTPKPSVAQLQMNTYTSETAELNALKSGSLDIGAIDAATQLGAIPGLRASGYSVFGGPSWGWFGGIINFKDTTDNWDKIIAQPYMKAVFAELINQPAIIKGVYHGWAVSAYGPIPTAPISPYAPADAAKAPYPYNPHAAAAALKAHGWSVKPGGSTICAKPGTGPGHCGAGIPKGNTISLVWANVPESTAASGYLESAAFASAAKRYAGITVNLVSKTFNFLTSNYNLQNPAAAKYVNDWAVNNYGGLFMDYYPTQDGVDNPGSGFNMGKYDDPVANRLIQNSVFSADPQAVKKEASYLTKNYPVFYMPDEDQIVAVSPKVGGPADAFLMLTQQTWAGNLFHVNKNAS